MFDINREISSARLVQDSLEQTAQSCLTSDGSEIIASSHFVHNGSRHQAMPTLKEVLTDGGEF